MAGTLFVVATPIGNLEDITARALRVLREVDLIAAEDTRRTAHLLNRFGISTPSTSLHEHNERGKSGALVGKLLAGQSIALVSDAGTPVISDPGTSLVKAAADAGIRVEPIPGPSALTALLSVAGFEGTRFTFLGFPPPKAKARKDWLELLRLAGPIAVFYEAPHRIEATLSDILRAIGDVPVVVGRELTKAHEELVRGPISVALPRVAGAPGEFVVAVFLGESPHRGVAATPPAAAEIRLVFGQLTDSGGATRRGAIAQISRRFGISARDVYALLEESKTSAS